MAFYTFRARHAAALLMCVLFFSCNLYRDAGFRAHYRDANQLAYANAGNPEKQFLKVHHARGDVYILGDTWQIDAEQEMVSGTGVLYDFNRKLLREGYQQIPFDSIVLFETNRLPGSNEKSRIAGLRLLAGVDVLLGVICLTVQKACFGSCPTFYFEADADTQFAHAEGFSNAIAPNLAYRDIDALTHPKISDGRISLVMKNEAYETHSVNYANLLVFPVQEGEQVYHTPDDRFFLGSDPMPPQSAVAHEGDITYSLAAHDKVERYSLSDPDNMAGKEDIYLTFDMSGRSGLAESDQLGLTIGFRQTLMTTYLIYHALDCMGNQVGDFLSGISHDPESEISIASGIKKELGHIDVYIWSELSGTWEYQGGFDETGPIAINHQMLPLHLTERGELLRVRLSLNKGLWRIDYAGLTNLAAEVEPVEISPVSLLKNSREDFDLLHNLLDQSKHLVSLPGDMYTLEYELPSEQADYAVFLATSGFYLIWNREAWTREKDLLSLYQMKHHPSRFLRRQAQEYKAYEAIVEDAFWNSRINQQIITRHEQ